MQVLMVAPVGELRSELEEAGYAVVGAENYEEAVRCALLCPPDVIVVAAPLSGMSGSELVRELRMSRTVRLRSVPVVAIVSGLDTNRALIAAGAHCTVRKPACEGELVKAVRWAKDVYGVRGGN
jgi:DNA-binding response OmpR family regulator